MVDAVRQQVQIVVEEVSVIKNEIINLKASHAGLHQTNVDTTQTYSRSINEITNKLDDLEAKLPFGSGFQKKAFTGTQTSRSGKVCWWPWGTSQQIP